MGGVGSKKKSEVHTLIPLTKTVLVVRHECRLCFGPSFADKWGFFVDRNMSTQIHSYLDWIRYPKGDRVLEGHTQWVFCGEISRDGYFLFTAARDRSLFKWDLRTNMMIRRSKVDFEAITSLAHTPGLLVLAGSNGKIKVKNDEDFSQVRSLEGHSREVHSISLNKQGTILVSGSDDMTCRVWSMDNGECMRVMNEYTDYVRSVLFADDVIVTGSYDGSIRFWNSETGKELTGGSDSIDGLISDISLNCDSSMLVRCYSNGLTLFQYPSMEVMSTIEMQAYHSHFHPSMPTILAVSDDMDHSIKVIHTDNSEIIRTLKGHISLIRSLRFSPDGYRLISVADDNTVRIWDMSEI